MPQQYQFMANIFSRVSSAGVVKEHGVYWDGITLTLHCKYFTMARGHMERDFERELILAQKKRSSILYCDNCGGNGKNFSKTNINDKFD